MASSFSSPWPDPNSPVLSKIDFGVPLVELFKWLDIRDTFLGENNKKQDITAALALARDCKHPDAEWLTSVFEGKDVSTNEDAREVFLLHQTDARALCFTCWFTNDHEDALLRRAASMGNAFACSTLCDQVLDESKDQKEFFRLAQFAALQHERDGFRLLGDCFDEGIGCEKDLKLVKENLLIAAELGHVYAALDFGKSLDRSDPVRWLWFGRAALRGSPHDFLYKFPNQVTGSGNATVVFLIGRALKGNIDMEKKEIFGQRRWKFDYANQAVSFYDSQIKHVSQSTHGRFFPHDCMWSKT